MPTSRTSLSRYFDATSSSMNGASAVQYGHQVAVLYSTVHAPATSLSRTSRPATSAGPGEWSGPDGA